MGWDALEFVPSGLITDQPSANLPDQIVNTAMNVDFFTGTTRALSEVSALTVPVGAPNCLQFFENATIRKFAYGTLIGARAWDGASDASIMPTSGLTGSVSWDMGDFGGYLVATSGNVAENPHAMLASASVLAPLPGWVANQSCRYIESHRNVLWAADMIEGGQPYPNRVRWSASAATGGLPQTWVPLASNDAGQQDLQIPGGQIYGMCALADSMYIGGPGGIWSARWQGGAYVYQFAARTTEWGMRGRRCMVSIGDMVAVLTRNDLIIIDDSTHKSLAIGRVATALRNMGEAQLLYLEAARQLYLLYGLSGEVGFSRALIWDRDTDSWGSRVFAATMTAFGKGLNLTAGAGPTWTTIAGAWDAAGATPWDPVGFDTDIYLAANASLIGKPGGLAWNWSVSRDQISGPDGETIRVRSLEVDIDGPIGQAVQLRLGSSQFAGQSPSWGPIGNYTLGSGPLRHDNIQRGRYISWYAAGQGQARLARVRMFYRVNQVKP